MRCLWIATMLLCAATLLSSTGCGKNDPPEVAEVTAPKMPLTSPSPRSTASSRPAVATPVAQAAPRTWNKPIVCQPHLIKADGTDTQQGTGFFVRAAGGKIAAVSSAHFLDFDGSPVVKAEWLRIPDDDVAATMTTSWGEPGRGGTEDDMTTDYWIMPVADAEKAAVAATFEVLEFDPRPRPNNLEPVWFPNKNWDEKLGFTAVDGRVVLSGGGSIMVEFNGELAMQSQSGSPLISRVTNQVLGTLTSGGTQAGKTYLFFAPVTKMRTVVERETSFPPLKTVIGKASG